MRLFRTCVRSSVVGWSGGRWPPGRSGRRSARWAEANRTSLPGAQPHHGDQLVRGPTHVVVDDHVVELVGRGTEGPAERERRLATASVEPAAADEFDHVIVNDDVRRATDELISVMRLRTR